MRRSLPYVILFLIVAAWTVAIRHTPFFWDAVQLGSKHAHHFFANGLRWTLLPTEIDSGHPPVFGFYIAIAWTFFGKSLVVSHWAMFPFLVGIAWLSYRFGQHLGGPKWAFWLVPIVLLDPVMAGQSAQIGPDIVLACFFLLAVWSLMFEKKMWAALAIAGLCLISTRGMMTAAALLFWQVLASWLEQCRFPNIFQKSLVFLPGFGAAAWFLCWHYSQTGWVGYHPDSPWAPSFKLVDFPLFLKNILVLGWRWVDLGRIFEWGVLLGLMLHPRSRKTLQNLQKKPMGSLVIMLGCLLLFLSPSALMYHNLSAHRYFLPLFLCFHLLIFHWLATAQLTKSLKKAGLVLLVVGLGGGNLWLYPRGISMDWDATLAHLPYHQLRAEMMRYLDRQQIPLETVGTTFPNINTGEDLFLNGDQRKCAEKDFSKNRYMLASNVFNDFSESDYQILEQHWQLVKQVRQAGVWINLYKKPD